jgi:hypothetical protein
MTKVKAQPRRVASPKIDDPRNKIVSIGKRQRSVAGPIKWYYFAFGAAINCRGTGPAFVPSLARRIELAPAEKES